MGREQDRPSVCVFIWSDSICIVQPPIICVLMHVLIIVWVVSVGEIGHVLGLGDTSCHSYSKECFRHFNFYK